jgi:hypothetical protein
MQRDKGKAMKMNEKERFTKKKKNNNNNKIAMPLKFLEKEFKTQISFCKKLKRVTE